jgi:hypothetical protein
METKNCFWLLFGKEPRECNVGGEKCPYTRMKWERCKEGKIEQDRRDQKEKEKDDFAEKLSTSIMKNKEYLFDIRLYKKHRIIKELTEAIRKEL